MLVHLLTVFGEAASQIPLQWRQKHPSLPWPKIIGLRNRLVHAYHAIDYEVVWGTTTGDFPSVLPLLKQMLAEEEKADT